MLSIKKILTPMLCALAACASASAVAAAYPDRPIRLVVAYGPGSGADILARIVADKLGGALGASVVVENREGAGGLIGSTIVAGAAPDGYTLLMAPTSMAVGPHMQAKPPYDPVKSFTPIARLAVLPMAIVTSQDSPYKTLGELIDYAKANPGKLNYATSGKGSPSHLEMELIRKRYGLELRDVPYKNVGQAMTDTIAGQISVYFPTFPSALPHLNGGKVRGLAIGSPERSKQAPQLPTIAEQLKLPGYEASVWYGLVAPAGLPAPIVEQLAKAAEQVLARSDVQSAIEQQGAQSAPMGPAPFKQMIIQENSKWKDLVKDLGLQAQ